MARFFPWRRNIETTNVSPTTEVGIPKMTWWAMMVWGPLCVLFCWCIGWLLWYYDALQNGSRWYHWSRSWEKWLDNGGWVLVAISILFIWLLSTALAFYRMMTEQGAKAWRSEYGWYYPGKRVPPDERMM